MLKSLCGDQVTSIVGHATSKFKILDLFQIDANYSWKFKFSPQHVKKICYRVRYFRGYKLKQKGLKPQRVFFLMYYSFSNLLNGFDTKRWSTFGRAISWHSVLVTLLFEYNHKHMGWKVLKKLSHTRHLQLWPWAQSQVQECTLFLKCYLHLKLSNNFKSNYIHKRNKWTLTRRWFFFWTKWQLNFTTLFRIFEERK